jgi:hypothetical protein
MAELGQKGGKMLGALQTRTGRVVYSRKRHYFDIRFMKRLADLLVDIQERSTDDEIIHSALSINACFHILAKGLYAQAYIHLHPSPEGTRYLLEDGSSRVLDRNMLYRIIREILYDYWMALAQIIAKRIMERFNIPSQVAQLIIDWAWDPVQEIMEEILSPLFEKE